MPGEVSKPAANRNPRVILSANIDGQRSVTALNRQMWQRKIVVHRKNDSVDVQFVQAQLSPGDCLLFNRSEEVGLEVASAGGKGESVWKSLRAGAGKTAKRKLMPMVLYQAKDKAKRFGLIDKSILSGMVRDRRYREIDMGRILEYAPRGQDKLTILYVACPRHRNRPCNLTIKHRGKWVKDAKGGRFKIQVLARSKREAGDGRTSYRTLTGGDTPQGIYTIWASMYSKSPAYGGVPRIDIDGAHPPINAAMYDQNAFLMSHIVPPESFDQYWINELPLAYKLGRVYLRIHSDEVAFASLNNKSANTAERFRPTSGCINAGANMSALLRKLTEIGVFTRVGINKTKKRELPLGWRISPSFGRVFMVVKDIEG